MRKIPKDEEEPLEHSELCIRVMESFFDRVEGDTELNDVSMELYWIYADVLAEQLAPYAYYLASFLYSKQPSAVAERLERAEKEKGMEQVHPSDS